MEDRIRKFIEYKGISPSELADAIGVQRSNVTHVLKGRNKPSFQFIEKLLLIYPEINAKWLLLGEGKMFEGSIKPGNLFDQIPEPTKKTAATEMKSESGPAIETDLFSQNVTAPVLQPVDNEKDRPENESNSPIIDCEKPIEKLIVIFKDQTFKVYNPSR